jgi:hypothetical protein
MLFMPLIKPGVLLAAPSGNARGKGVAFSGITMRGLVVLALACALADPAAGQWTMGARSIAMGQAHTALPYDAWAVFHNPAALTSDRPVLGFFSIRYYGLRELEDHAVVLSLSGPGFMQAENRKVAFGTGIHTYGFDLYRETRARISASLRFERFRIGLSASYVHIRIQGYGSRGSPVFDAGIIAGLSESLRIGYRITHLMDSVADGLTADLHPAEMAVGLSWDGIKGLLVTADAVKDSLHPVSLRAGAETALPGRLFLRGGWTSRPFTWSAGTGLQLGSFQGNLAVQRHDVLGLSPGIDFQLTF